MINIFTGSFCPEKTHNRTLFFDSTLLKHSGYFDYWNPPLNMRMFVCYLECHEAGLCCYLVIHIENLLRQLQLFYFHCDLFTDSPSYWTWRMTEPYLQSPYIVVPTQGCHVISQTQRSSLLIFSNFGLS
jgi:hypothetical protein